MFFSRRHRSACRSNIFNPFGAQPRISRTRRSNRYTSQTYTCQSVHQGRTPGDVCTTSCATTTSGPASNSAPVTDGNRSLHERVVGNVRRDRRPVRLVGRLRSQQRSKFSDAGPAADGISTRARDLTQSMPQLRAVRRRGGYEDNHYPLADYSGPIYGVGAKWHPTDRTNVEAAGSIASSASSYHLTFDHRTPLSVWSAARIARHHDATRSSSRRSAPASDVDALLNQLFRSRIPDPAQRQTFVEQFIHDRGLPPVLSSALSACTRNRSRCRSRCRRDRRAPRRAQYRLLDGVPHAQRADHDVRTFRPPTSLERLSQQHADRREHRLDAQADAALYVLTTSGDWRANGRQLGRSEAASTNSLRSAASLSAPLSPVTIVFAGVRYQHAHSECHASDYNETAVLRRLHSHFPMT